MPELSLHCVVVADKNLLLNMPHHRTVSSWIKCTVLINCNYFFFFFFFNAAVTEVGQWNGYNGVKLTKRFPSPPASDRLIITQTLPPQASQTLVKRPRDIWRARFALGHKHWSINWRPINRGWKSACLFCYNGRCAKGWTTPKWKCGCWHWRWSIQPQVMNVCQHQNALCTATEAFSKSAMWYLYTEGEKKDQTASIRAKYNANGHFTDIDEWIETCVNWLCTTHKSMYIYTRMHTRTHTHTHKQNKS